jgi:hypothetical protein
MRSICSRTVRLVGEFLLRMALLTALITIARQTASR